MKRFLVCLSACLLSGLTSSSASAQLPQMLNVMRMIPLNQSLDVNGDDGPRDESRRPEQGGDRRPEAGARGDQPNRPNPSRDQPNRPQPDHSNMNRGQQNGPPDQHQRPDGPQNRDSDRGPDGPRFGGGPAGMQPAPFGRQANRGLGGFNGPRFDRSGPFGRPADRSPGHVAGSPDRRGAATFFDQLDANHDGSLSREEFQRLAGRIADGGGPGQQRSGIGREAGRGPDAAHRGDRRPGGREGQPKRMESPEYREEAHRSIDRDGRHDSRDNEGDEQGDEQDDDEDDDMDEKDDDDQDHEGRGVRHHRPTAASASSSGIDWI